MRHHTSGSAGSVISLPRIAVKPHSSTQKWICSCALLVGLMRSRVATGRPLSPQSRSGALRLWAMAKLVRLRGTAGTRIHA